MPPVDVLLLERGNEGHTFGAKGCSEVSLVGVAPAIRNAIYHATGVRVNAIPLTPDRILAAMTTAEPPARRG
jgi:CO/xanthine dehydrogenase Mo-binding subunit